MKTIDKYDMFCCIIGFFFSSFSFSFLGQNFVLSYVSVGWNRYSNMMLICVSVSPSRECTNDRLMFGVVVALCGWC